MGKIAKSNGKRPRTTTIMAPTAAAIAIGTIVTPNDPITEGATSSTAEVMEPTTSINSSAGGTEPDALLAPVGTTWQDKNAEDNDSDVGDQEMEVDSDTGVTDLYPDTPPSNFREVATNTLASLKAENIALSEQIVYMSTLLAGRPPQHLLQHYQQQIAINKDKEKDNAQLIKQLESSLYELRIKKHPGSTISAHSTILTPTAATATIANNTPTAVVATSMTQQAAIKPTPDMPRFSLNPATAYETNETRVFLERFATHLKTRLGMDTFENECHRYLIVLTNDDHYQQELQRRFAAIEGNIGWDMAEKVFLSICLTKEERLENMRNMADMGRNMGETYNRYSARILRHARVNGIQDDNDIILHQLGRSIPGMEYDFLLFKHQIKNPDATAFKSINTLCALMSTLTGPEDAIDQPRAVGRSQDQLQQQQQSFGPRHNTFTNGVRGSRGASRGALRGTFRGRGQGRMNPMGRSNSQPPFGQAPGQPPRAGMKFCQGCSWNNSHETKDCRFCTFCSNRGHTYADCRTRMRQEQQQNGTQGNQQS
ncbi:hypothetical protein KI688_005935 [Linnemannia hyalina]|uniref:Uncharacterized protein n=2 Tax=Linnemannia hyalina TaxID=64524 RepID=A0A9P7Y2G0_9FUNG|nr:hypothetical protein KI688_005935 [Linnemannia hyalina]